MSPTEKSITKTQLFCLIVIVGLASSVLTLPSVLAAEAGRDLWAAVIISFAAYSAVFFAVVQVYRLNPDTDIYTVLKKSIGTAGAKIIFAVLAVFFGYKTLTLFRETEEFCLNKLFQSLPWHFYAVILTALIAFIAARGLKSLARCGELSLVFITASLLVCLGAAAGQADAGRLLPVLENGFAPAFKGFYKTAAWYGDSLLLLMVMGRVKVDKKVPAMMYAGYGITALVLTGFMLAYYALYGSISGFQGHGQAFANITNFSRDSSMGLVSSIFNQFWLLACFIKAAALFWALNEAVRGVLGVRQITNYNVQITNSGAAARAVKCQGDGVSDTRCQLLRPRDTEQVKGEKLVTRSVNYSVPVTVILAVIIYILDVFVFKAADAAFYMSAAYVNYAAMGIYAGLPAIALICAAVYRKNGKGQTGKRQS